jgi:uncharacterized protein YdhG (YjbR/CyaY superfamily)
MPTKRRAVVDSPSDVESYIARAPPEARKRLRQVRAAIREVSPGAIETTSYFELPGYSYPAYSYNYNGMFAWFSYRETFIGLHLWPAALKQHAREIRGYSSTKSILRLPIDGGLPIPLIKKLVKTSIRILKQKKEPKAARH